MDMAKFYDWKYVALVGALAISSHVPVICKGVYELLVEDGMAESHGQILALTEKGITSVKQSKRRSDRLMGELIKENERLIRKFVGRIKRGSNTFNEEADLYQAGCMGFVQTMERYEPAKAAFSTFAGWWIRDFVQKDLARQVPFRRPKRFGMPYKTYLISQKIRALHGRAATPEELGVSAETMREWETFPVVFSLNHSTPKGDTGGAMTGSHDNDGFGWDGDNSALATNIGNPEDAYEKEDCTNQIRDAMQFLTPMERDAVEGQLEGVSFTALAVKWKCSKQLVQQAHVRALQTLREELVDE